MNAEYLFDTFLAFKAQGMDLSKIHIRVMVKEEDHTVFYNTTGTAHAYVDEDSEGVFTIEAVPDV